ncbi:ornithine cyclodeaminase family protein [Limoniibacter endophyticus]|uniref:ornithine cyclodeaminase family protein n=1 Tax=Limoniibacter endophyticus TaxID=1565040 RepID=UPI001675600D|nr:ornithine cyclodeaminase family protein [Limoniibacter endophyticus]
MPDLLHISKSDVLALKITPAQMRASISDVFADLAAGKCRFEPKSQLQLGVGQSFQMMAAASYTWSMAVVKWVSVVPTGPASKLPAISAVLCLNDTETGHPLAFIDGEIITLQRTAAMAAVSAQRLARDNPEVLALVGCGAQARSQLLAFTDVFPSLRKVLCHSRSRSSAQALADMAAEHGLEGVVMESADDLIRDADIIISMVPAAPDLEPFLDASRLKPDALAVMVDLGRSWLPDSLTCFSQFATDSLEQMQHPMDARGHEVKSARINADLISGLTRSEGRQAFCFKGHSAGDLAAAKLVYDLAREKSLGQTLSR